MKWKFDGNDVVLYFEKKTAGHLWMGLGKTMTNADIFKIAKTNGGTDLTVEDCYVNGHVAPTCTETSHITVEHKEATPTSLKVQIRRPKSTGDSNDRAITDTTNDILYSYTSNDTPEVHSSNYGSVNVDLSKSDGGLSSVATTRSKWGNGTFMAHEHGMTLNWTIICDILIVVGKYLKKFNRWFDVHAWTFFALGITTAILTANAPKGGKGGDRMLGYRDLADGEINVLTGWAKKDLHETTGMIGNIITYVMIVQGLIIRFVIALDKRKKHLHISFGSDLTIFRRVHTILGIAVWILTRIALLTGAGLHSVSYGSTLYFFILGEIVLFFILYVIFEAIYRFKRKNWKYPLTVAVTKKGDYSKMMEMIRSKGN